MKDLMRQMKETTANLEHRIDSVQTNFGQRFDPIGKQLETFKAELRSLTADMATKRMFADLVCRAAELKGGVTQTKASWMQRQIIYLDLANMPLRFQGFSEKDDAKRAAEMEE